MLHCESYFQAEKVTFFLTSDDSSRIFWGVHPSHFFKYYTAEVAQIVLSTKKIRWSSPYLFNDPFDCYFSAEHMGDIDQFIINFRQRFVDLISNPEEPAFLPSHHLAPTLRKFRNKFKSRPRAELEELFANMDEEYRPIMEMRALEERALWKQEAADYRLFCVCETNNNLLLWSHYGQNHYGACFQLECHQALDVPLLAAEKVIYSNDPPSIVSDEEWIKNFLGMATPTDADHEAAWKRLVTTKAKAWEIEQEWRVITRRRPYETAGYEDTEFDPSEISKVFLGCRMEECERAQILNLLTGDFAHVEAYQARQNPKKFELQFERIK